MLKKFFVIILVCCLLLVNTSCGTPLGGEETTGTENPAEDPNRDWSGDHIVVQDLGTMKLENYPVDMNYDWKFSAMKVEDGYKLWWCRQYYYDAIWYAESTDMVNLVNEQVVLDIPSDSYHDREWAKLHVGYPSVVKVNDTYYMYFESPATILDAGECDNNIFLATSTDGIHFTMYPSNDDPQPIIRMPEEEMRQGKYGVGQPSVCYYDGVFYMWYTDAVNTSGMRFATSTDGLNFGEYEDHPLVFDRTTCGVKYNEVIGKFIMAYEADPKTYGNADVSNSSIYLNFSEDGINWEIKSLAENNEANKISSDKVLSRAYPDFVTDERGVVTTETMYVTFTEAGRMAEPGEDFRATSPSWDGHLVAVNLKQYAQKPMILPNGELMNEETLRVYSNKWEVYTHAAARVNRGTPVIDGVQDAVWDKTPILNVNRLTGVSNSLKTGTTGELRFLWDENASYFYGVILDQDISYSNEKITHRDSITLYINVDNSQKIYKKGAWNVIWQDWTEGVIGVTVCVDGTYRVFGPSNTNITDVFSGIELKSKATETGWEFEVKIPWHPAVQSKVKTDRIIGFEAQINDAISPGYRRSIILWNDLRANAVNNVNCFGQIKLVE